MSTTMNEIKINGFLASLFDMSFSSFVTTKLVKILYALGIVTVAIGALIMAAIAFSWSSGFGLFFVVIVAPVLSLVAIIYLRVTMELMIVLFRVAEEITVLARR